MLQYDFEASIGYWICLTSHFYQQQLNEELAPYGITFRQFQVLGWLVHEGDLSQTELARRLMIEPPTLVGILDRMQREGWIERQSSNQDRRCKLIHLRPSAKKVWAKVVACLNKMRQRATVDMAPDELNMLKTLLKQVQLNLGVDVGERDPDAKRRITVGVK